ncbi:MAG: TRCF domain-containing protein, partial [Gaiellales bacterium]
QSGHVAAVGFELYVELLGEAVAELSGTARRTPRPVRIDAQVDAYIPAEYIDAEALKIDLHRRLALVADEDEVRELEVATADRFGEIPEPVANLFSIQRAKLRVAEAGCEYLVYRDGRVAVGPLVLGSSDLKGLRSHADTAVYRSAQREVTLRVASLGEALALLAAILEIVA